MWEACPTGGSWIVRFKKQGKQHKSSPTLAKCWEELLFATVGEFFEDPDVIGIVVGIKTTEDVLQVPHLPCIPPAFAASRCVAWGECA